MKKKSSKSNISQLNSPPTKQPPELTTAQISQTVYLSCIALARLISENYDSRYKKWQSEDEFDEDEENVALEATTLYLMALKERFGLCIDSVQEFSDVNNSFIYFIYILYIIYYIIYYIYIFIIYLLYIYIYLFLF